LIEDKRGRPYRQWRDHIQSADDIWKEIVNATEIPGTTSAPKLQPIAARIVMLQSGMRAPMGVKVKGPDLETIEKVGPQIEKFLKEVPSVEPSAVIADRVVGKPYLEIDIDREAIARYGVRVRDVQDVIEIAIGGKRITTTVEGRERYPVRVRYLRELRDTIESLEEILVSTKTGAQIPVAQLAEIRQACLQVVVDIVQNRIEHRLIFPRVGIDFGVEGKRIERPILSTDKESAKFTPKRPNVDWWASTAVQKSTDTFALVVESGKC